MSSTPFGANIVMLMALIGVFVILTFVVIFGIYLIFFARPEDPQPAKPAGGRDGRAQN
jgi:archaellum biogenesis protein FlaJ (TadC family)